MTRVSSSEFLINHPLDQESISQEGDCGEDPHEGRQSQIEQTRGEARKAGPAESRECGQSPVSQPDSHEENTIKQQNISSYGDFGPDGCGQNLWLPLGNGAVRPGQSFPLVSSGFPQPFREWVLNKCLLDVKMTQLHPETNKEFL